MPKIQWTHTKAQKAEYEALIKRMNAAGADLDPTVSDSPWITVTHNPYGCDARTCRGVAILVVHLRIVARVTTFLKAFELWSPEEGWSADLLEDPRVSKATRQLYGTADREKFHRNDVLNHHVEHEGVLRRGNHIEGFLLAQGSASVPLGYSLHRRLPLCVSIVSQFDDVCHYRLDLPVRHVPWQIKPRPSGTGGLLELAAGRTVNDAYLPPQKDVLALETPKIGICKAPIGDVS